MPGGTPLLMVSGFNLPTHLAHCRCGARTVDVYSYLEHDNLKGQCTACGVVRADWIPHETLGLAKHRRSTRFKVSPARRWEVFQRDGFTCVHCGSTAPRSSEVLTSIQHTLLDIFGQQQLSVSSSNHARTCITCGQMLPGVFQTLSWDQMQRMTSNQKNQLFGQLESRRLTIDHVFPESLLEMDGIINGKQELKLVSQTFLVTACVECNLGRRATLEEWNAIERLLVATALRDGVSPETDLLHAKEIHFRARHEIRRRAG